MAELLVASGFTKDGQVIEFQYDLSMKCLFCQHGIECLPVFLANFIGDQDGNGQKWEVVVRGEHVKKSGCLQSELKE